MKKGGSPTEIDTDISLMSAPMNDMRSEQDILHDRIDKDLAAFGEFSAIDLIDNSVCPDDFSYLDGISVETEKKMNTKSE